MPHAWPRSLLALVLFVGLAASTSAASSQHDTVASRVSLDVADVHMLGSIVEFTLHSRADRTATAWVVEFGPPTDAGAPRGSMSVDCYKLRVLPDTQPQAPPSAASTSGCPLAPGAEAVIRGSGPADLLDARAVAVIFDDGTFEGRAAEMLARREAEARACDKWLSIIDAAMASDDDVAVSLLRVKLDAARSAHDELVATELVGQLLKRVIDERASLRSALTFVRDYLGRVRREATRHVTHASA